MRSRVTTPKNTDGVNSRDNLARRVAFGSLMISGLSLAVSSCQAWIGYQQLQDNRAAAIKIEAKWPVGTYRSPDAWMQITNLTDHVIPNARVGARLALLPPDVASDIFKSMEYRSENIQSKGMEPQHLFADGSPQTNENLEKWRAGKLVLVAGLSVTWRDRGAWTDTTNRRCYAWTFGGETACEDLIALGRDAPAYVSDFIAAHPNSGPREGQEPAGG